MRSKLTLSLDDANAMMAAGIDAARMAGLHVAIAVVDDAGALLAFQRMDGARVHTIDLAQRKARAAAMAGVPTSMIEAMLKDRPAQSADMAVAGGGVPAMHAGQCAGAVGVSGAKTAEDEAICSAARSALPAS